MYEPVFEIDKLKKCTSHTHRHVHITMHHLDSAR